MDLAWTPLPGFGMLQSSAAVLKVLGWPGILSGYCLLSVLSEGRLQASRPMTETIRQTGQHHLKRRAGLLWACWISDRKNILVDPPLWAIGPASPAPFRRFASTCQPAFLGSGLHCHSLTLGT